MNKNDETERLSKNAEPKLAPSDNSAFVSDRTSSEQQEGSGGNLSDLESSSGKPSSEDASSSSAARGRRRRSSRKHHLTEEEYKDERRAANRKSAYESRQRKKILIDDLQDTVKMLSKQNATIRREAEALRAQLDTVLKDNVQLRLQLQLQQGQAFTGTSQTTSATASSATYQPDVQGQESTGLVGNTTVPMQQQQLQFPGGGGGGYNPFMAGNMAAAPAPSFDNVANLYEPAPIPGLPGPQVASLDPETMRMAEQAQRRYLEEVQRSLKQDDED